METCNKLDKATPYQEGGQGFVCPDWLILKESPAG